MSDDKKTTPAGADQTTSADNSSDSGAGAQPAETKAKKVPVAGRSSMTKADVRQFGLSASVNGKGLK